jgi:hypothetical protein
MVVFEAKRLSYTAMADANDGARLSEDTGLLQP